jgi:hypothetical protein
LMLNCRVQPRAERNASSTRAEYLPRQGGVD